MSRANAVVEKNIKSVVCNCIFYYYFETKGNAFFSLQISFEKNLKLIFVEPLKLNSFFAILQKI